MTSGLLEKYISYSLKFKGALNNYISMYGKDALYLRLPDADKIENANNIYLNALGKDQVSFDIASRVIHREPVKLLFDYADFYKVQVGNSVDTLLYFSDANSEPVTSGDMILNQFNNKISIYTIRDNPDTYQSLIYRVNLQLVIVKDADAFTDTTVSMENIL